MKIIKFIKDLYRNDPVINCKVFKDLGCSHIDGMLCDFPECSINKEYLREIEIFNLEQELDIPYKYRYYNKN